MSSRRITEHAKTNPTVQDSLQKPEHPVAPASVVKHLHPPLDTRCQERLVTANRNLRLVKLWKEITTSPRSIKAYMDPLHRGTGVTRRDFILGTALGTSGCADTKPQLTLHRASTDSWRVSIRLSMACHPDALMSVYQIVLGGSVSWASPSDFSALI